MNKYVILSIDEGGQFGESSILVKVNPVEIVTVNSRVIGSNYIPYECEDTLWLLFRYNPNTNNLQQLINYAKACESGVFLGLDIDNWFKKEEMQVFCHGNLQKQDVYFSLDHDEYFDEMEYYYQTHGNEDYSNFEEEQYIARQRRRREAGLMYDDDIDLLDEENEWDY